MPEPTQSAPGGVYVGFVLTSRLANVLPAGTCAHVLSGIERTQAGADATVRLDQVRVRPRAVRVDLDLWRGGGHHDHGTGAQFAGAQRHALGVVACRGTDHTLFQLFGRQVRHLVVGPTQLEAVHRLLVFALQKNLVAQAARQVFGRFQRRLGGHVIDLGVQDLDQVIGGFQVWGRHVRRDGGRAASPIKIWA